jgi:hypothetical protein
MNPYLWRAELKNSSRDIVWVMLGAMVWVWSTAGLYDSFMFGTSHEKFAFHIAKAVLTGMLLGTACLPIVMIFNSSVQEKRSSRMAMLATLPIEPVSAALHRYIPIILIQSLFYFSLFGISRVVGQAIGRSGFAFLNFTLVQIGSMQVVSIIVTTLYFFLSHIFPRARLFIYWTCSFITVSGYLSYSRFVQSRGWGDIPGWLFFDLCAFCVLLLAIEIFLFMKNKNYAFGKNRRLLID